MKTKILLVLVLCMALLMTACGGKTEAVETTAQISDRTTVTVDIPEGYPITDTLLVNYAASVTITPENATLRGGNNLPAPAFCWRIS